MPADFEAPASESLSQTPDTAAQSAEDEQPFFEPGYVPEEASVDTDPPAEPGRAPADPQAGQSTAGTGSRKYSAEHYQAAQFYAGLAPADVDALGWDKLAPLLQRQREAMQRQHTPTQNPDAGRSPANPQTARAPEHSARPPSNTPAGWTWEDADDLLPVDPRIVKYSEYVDQLLARQKQEFETRLQEFAGHIQPVQQLIQAQQEAARQQAGRTFNGAVEQLDSPDLYGTAEAMNWQARNQLWEFAHQILQAGRVPSGTLEEATQMAHRALHGVRIEKQRARTVAARAEARRGQVVAQPSHRDADLPLGHERAARAVRRRIAEQG